MSLEQKQIINQFIAEFGFDPFSLPGRQDKLREAAQQAPMAYYALVIKADSGYESTTEGRCTADQYGAAIAALHGTAALAQQDTQAAGESLRDLAAKYIAEDEAAESSINRLMTLGRKMADAINAAPTPPAPKPLGWLDRKAVECLQGPELNWMPAWNRPTSADPVPIFLLPPAQRVMLTDEEISRIYTEQTGAAIEDSPWALRDFAHAVIEAYERKNGLKP